MKESDKIISTKKFYYNNIKGMVTLDGKWICWGGISAELNAWKKDIQYAALKAL